MDKAESIKAYVVSEEGLQEFEVKLGELTEEEREFLLICYEDAKLSDSGIAKRMGLPRTTVQSRRVKLIEKLQKRFAEEEIENF